MASTAAPGAEAPSETVHDNVDKNSEYYKINELPVDRGWAWVICFGGFLTYMTFGLANQTVVVMFVEIVIEYEATITTASLIFMFGVLSLSAMSLIATNVLVPRIGERRVVMFAGIFFSVGSVGYSLAPNIYVFICFAIVKGLAAGAIFVPSISLIRHYFHKRRSIAQIIANTGQSVSVIVGPPIIRLIRKEFGISGTFLILAAVELHITVAGLLLRPIEAYKFRPVLPPMPYRGKNKGKKAVGKGIPDQQPSNEEETATDTNLETGENKNIMTNHASPQKRSENGHLSSTGAQNSSVTEKLLANNGDPTTLRNRNTDPECGNSKDKDEKNQRYSDTRHYASALSLVSEAGAEAAVEMVIGEEEEENNKEVGTQKKKRFCQGCGYAFCSTWTFRMILLTSLFGAANLYMKNYIPTITKTQGATLDESALLLTIVGAVDLVSRLCLGLFADTHILRPTQILFIAQICLGILCQFIRLFTTFQTMIILAVILGTFIGTRISMMPLVAMEVVGVEMMPQAFSMMATVGTLSAASMNPILGAVAEGSGNFVLVMHVVGICFFISSALLLTLPILRKVDEKKLKSLHDN